MDEFILEAVTLKKLKKIRIGHDASNPGAGWFLDKVVVRQTDNPDYDTTFECNRCDMTSGHCPTTRFVLMVFALTNIFCLYC